MQYIFLSTVFFVFLMFFEAFGILPQIKVPGMFFLINESLMNLQKLRL